MLLRSKEAIAEALEQEIISKAAQGFEVGELQKELLMLPDSYDALACFCRKADRPAFAGGLAVCGAERLGRDPFGD